MKVKTSKAEISSHTALHASSLLLPLLLFSFFRFHLSRDEPRLVSLVFNVTMVPESSKEVFHLMYEVLAKATLSKTAEACFERGARLYVAVTVVGPGSGRSTESRGTNADQRTVPGGRSGGRFEEKQGEKGMKRKGREAFLFALLETSATMIRRFFFGFFC